MCFISKEIFLGIQKAKAIYIVLYFIQKWQKCFHRQLQILQMMSRCDILLPKPKSIIK